MNLFLSQPVFIVNHFKIYGECYCSNGRKSRCLTASEDDTYLNDGQQSALLCATDVKHLPFSEYMYIYNILKICFEA